MNATTSPLRNISILLCALAVPMGLAAQGPNELQQTRGSQSHNRYRLVIVDTLGGPASHLTITDPTAAAVFTNGGTLVSAADTSVLNPNFPNVCVICAFDPFTEHAFRWRGGVLTDLKALPGTNNSGAYAVSPNGLVAGFSENGQIDPILGVPQIRAVLWKNGDVIDLGTLEGGLESAAFGLNDRGQVIGGYTNTVPDPFSPFQVENHAFVWEKGVMRDLGTLGGPDAFPGFINERGQIVGFSFSNFTPNPVTNLPTQDPFLWETGKMLDLGTLGGSFGFPNSINNGGEVVGSSNLAGDLTTHAFLWTHLQGMQDLGTLGGTFAQANWINDGGEVVGWSTTPGDQSLLAFFWKGSVMTNLGAADGDLCSAAWNLNSRGDIVGTSSKTCSFTGEDKRAFLWTNGQRIDLNVFLPPGTVLQQLTDAYNINDRGEIVGTGVPPGCGDNLNCGRIFVLIPCDENHPEIDGCDYTPVEVSTVAASHATETQRQLTPEEISRIRALLMNRHRGLMPRTMH